MTEEKTGRPYDTYGYRPDYINNYSKSQLKQIRLALNRNTDADVIDFLDHVPSVRGYILKLIRDDMKRQIEEADK